MAAFDFAVVPGSKRSDGFMMDAKACGGDFEEGESGSEFRVEAVGELVAVVGLDATDGDSVFAVKSDRMDQEDRGGMGAVFLESHQEAKSGELIDGGVLVEVLPGQSIGAAGGRNELDIDLDLFAGKGHWSIGFGLIGYTCGIPNELHAAHHPVETYDVTGITPFP